MGRKWGQEEQEVPIINLQYFNSLSSTVKRVRKMKGGRLNKNFKCQYYRVTLDEILLHLQATKDLEEQRFQWHLHYIGVLSQKSLAGKPQI